MSLKSYPPPIIYPFPLCGAISNYAEKTEQQKRMIKMREWFPVNELVNLPEMPSTTDNVVRRANRENWESRPRPKGKGREYNITSLPPPAQTALIEKMKPPSKPNPDSSKRANFETEELWRIYDSLPQKSKDTAARRLETIYKWEELVAASISKKEADIVVADKYNIAPSTFRGWRAKVKNAHRSDWLAILAPQHSGCQTYTKIPPELWEPFKADFLRIEKPAASAVYDRIKRIAKAKNIEDIPNLKTFMRKLERELPRAAITRARGGSEAADKSFPPQQRDHSVFHALEAVSADGFTFRHFVTWEDGLVSRPCGWFNHDVLSGKFLNWRLDVSENRDLIRLALGDLVEQFGIPAFYIIDNTRAAANKWLTGQIKNRYRWKIKGTDPLGILPQLGIKTHFTLPAHGQAKPVERAFGIGGLSEIIDKHPAFAGRGTRKKPIPLAEFNQLLKIEIAHYNAKPGRRSPVCNGRSFDEVFNESYAKSEIKKVTEQQRRLLLLAAEGVTVNRVDAHIKLYAKPMGGANLYWSPKLSEYAGSKVVVRFDPANLHELVHVYTLDGKYICEAPCNRPAGFFDTDSARAHAKNKARFKKANKKALEAERRMTALAASKLLVDDEPNVESIPNAKIIAPIFGATSRKPANEISEKETISSDEALDLILKGLDIEEQNRERENF